MGEEHRARTFKSGNSVALRLPKALGIKEGLEMTVREERGQFIVEPAAHRDRNIDLDGIYGAVPGIVRPPCDQNPRDWDPTAHHD